jgi:hypothetical protein
MLQAIKNCLLLPCNFLKGFIMRDYARKENSLRNWRDVFAEWKAWMEAEMQKAFSTKTKER